MSEIITQTVSKTDGDDNDCIVSLELLGDPCGNNAQISFDPKSHGLSADFQLTKFSDPRRKSLQLERQERQSLLDLFHEKEVIFSMQNNIDKDFYNGNNYHQSLLRHYSPIINSFAFTRFIYQKLYILSAS